MQNQIIVKGARENNLKNIDVAIPKYQLVALTGVSGSGKSSFAIDILSKECQRQYMESMGMVTDGLNKPLVDSIEGLSPSISIGQRLLSTNPRSTVGTYTEILTYLRILYAKLGVRICSTCGTSIAPDFSTAEQAEIDNDTLICPHCKAKLKPLTMATFSFNKTEGACPTCNGLGIMTTVDYSKVVNEDLTISEGAFVLWGNEVFGEHYAKTMQKCADYYGFNFDTNKKVREFNALERLVFFKGVESSEFKALFPNKKPPKRVMDGYVEGIETFMQKKVAESANKKIKNSTIADALHDTICTDCGGTRLGLEGRTVTLDGVSITEVSKYTAEELLFFVQNLQLTEKSKLIAITIIGDLQKRLSGVIRIGLGYLSIDRAVTTLSGGESQRLRLVNVMDSGLTGVLYILDEPTTGLHPRDTHMLLQSIKRLRDIGNTVVVIEHDMDFVRACDYVIDFGEGAGIHGGEVVACGVPSELHTYTRSKTANYISSGGLVVANKTKPAKGYIEVRGARAHNLRSVSVNIPLGQLVTFTGVSGSGKSSLVFDVVASAAHCDSIKGLEHIKQIVQIDQKPIGRMSRSNIATYTDIFTPIRELFASQPDAKKLKLKASDFSFNIKGGRCEKCQGLGVITLDMQFLDDVEVTCPVCNGKRFKRKILSVNYGEKNISEILDSTVNENIKLFKNHKEILNRLLTLEEVGLGYLKLGQSTTTLSGGECQRIKLSKELGRLVQGDTLYMLDEPTTGLHPSDIEKIISLMQKLVAIGNSVFVIEHSLEVISQSDYIIDLGPEGGKNGGEIVAQGTPATIAQSNTSYTGSYLAAGCNQS